MGLLFGFQPQDAYGLEKLATEELCKHYTKDFGIECRIGRFHNIYGPFGTWKGKLSDYLNVCDVSLFDSTNISVLVSQVEEKRPLLLFAGKPSLLQINSRCGEMDCKLDLSPLLMSVLKVCSGKQLWFLTLVQLKLTLCYLSNVSQTKMQVSVVRLNSNMSTCQKNLNVSRLYLEGSIPKREYYRGKEVVFHSPINFSMLEPGSQLVKHLPYFVHHSFLLGNEIFVFRYAFF